MRDSRYEINRRMAMRRGFSTEFQLRDAEAKARGYRSYWHMRQARGIAENRRPKVKTQAGSRT